MKVYTPSQLKKMTKAQLRGVLRAEHNVDLDPDPGVTQVMLISDVLTWQEKAMLAPEAPEIEPAEIGPADVWNAPEPEIEPAEEETSPPDGVKPFPMGAGSDSFIIDDLVHRETAGELLDEHEIEIEPVGDHPMSSFLGTEISDPDTIDPIQTLPERILCVGTIPRRNRIPTHRCGKDTLAANECFVIYHDPQKATSPLPPPVDYILENAYCSGCLQKLLRVDPSVAYRQILVHNEVNDG